MIHPDRVFCFKELESEDELVEAMSYHKWPLCYSFYYGNLLYLEDGDSEDAPEYAVVTIDKREGHHDIIGREVGRIKPMGMDSALVHKLIQEMNAGQYSTQNVVRVVVEPKWHHSCQLCRLDEE
jgi:hypothetical protein